MKIIVTDQDGAVHELEGLEGWRVMEVIRDWGLPIKAECGGACACATCHVWVGEEWVAKLHPPSAEELEMLDGAFNVDERSRLCCQIIMSKELDGLEVELAPETLAPGGTPVALLVDGVHLVVTDQLHVLLGLARIGTPGVVDLLRHALVGPPAAVVRVVDEPAFPLEDEAHGVLEVWMGHEVPLSLPWEPLTNMDPAAPRHHSRSPAPASMWL